MAREIIKSAAKFSAVCHGCQSRIAKGSTVYLKPPPDDDHGWGVYCLVCRPKRQQKRGPRVEYRSRQTSFSDEEREMIEGAMAKMLDPRA